MVENLLIAWVIWCGFNLILMGLIAPIVATDLVNTGFGVRVPNGALDRFDRTEIEALLAHEEGHTHHWHVWRAYARTCVFMPYSAVRRVEMELEADDYAIKHGHADGLLAALHKYADDPRHSEQSLAFVHFRIQRIIIAVATSAPRGVPALLEDC